MEETPEVVIDEVVVLSKFEGEPIPENEFERVAIQNGEVIAHDIIEHGEVVGPVENSEIIGADVGSLISQDTVKEVE